MSVSVFVRQTRQTSAEMYMTADPVRVTIDSSLLPRDQKGVDYAPLLPRMKASPYSRPTLPLTTSLVCSSAMFM